MKLSVWINVLMLFRHELPLGILDSDFLLMLQYKSDDYNAEPNDCDTMAASALISGATPNLTFEKITIGNVLAPGPETKLEMTRSSTVKKSVPTIIDIWGRLVVPE